MFARIHHLKHGTEYVLQFNRKTNTIELRIIKHTLLGRFPNYFRHKWGTSCYEMDCFQKHLRLWRLPSGFSPYPDSVPLLSDEEKALIHKFEQIAGINLRLTPESVSRHRLGSMQEIARLPGIDTSAMISYSEILSRLRPNTDRRSAIYAQLDENFRQRLQMPNHLQQALRVDTITETEAPPPTDEPPIPQETPTLRNTEGLTEEQIQETEQFVARLLNGETLSARENPPLPNPNTDEDTDTPTDVNEAVLDRLLKDIEEAIEYNDTEKVQGAPTHPFHLPTIPDDDEA